MKNSRAAFFLAALTLLAAARKSEAWFEDRGSSGYALDNFETSGITAAQTGAGGTGFEFFNPAGFSSRYREEISLTFTPLFEGVNRYNASYALPLENRRTLWASVAAITVDDIAGTNELGEDTGAFGASETGMSAGYSAALSDGFFAGAAIKYYVKRIADYSASAATLDAGFVLRQKDSEAGIAVVSVVPASLGADAIRPSLRGGIKQYFAYRRASVGIDLLYQGLFGQYTALKWFAGVEYEYPRGITWRAGADRKSVSAGFGLDFRRAVFDYGIFYHPMGIVHSFTVTSRFSLDPSAAELRAEEELQNLRAEAAASSTRAKLERRMLTDERARLVKERKISAMYLSAARDFGEKKYARAEGKLAEILRIDPSNEEAKRLLAEIKAVTSEAIIKRKMLEMETDYENGRYESVVENALWIIDVRPDHEKARVYAYLARARMYAAEKKYNDAKGELYEAIKIQPTNSEALGFLKRVQTVMDLEAK
jgi:tetratricopeptide (TPR) repeat protein